MPEKVPLSPEAYDRLKAEYDDLTTVGRIDIARKIETARELGDLSENGDYHAAKEEKGKMEGRIMHLNQMLENAEIVEGEGSSVVISGSVVVIRYADSDDDERYLVGSIEEQHRDLEVISYSSPLGQALIGHGAGDTITYKTPAGAVLEVALVEVS